MSDNDRDRLTCHHGTWVGVPADEYLASLTDDSDEIRAMRARLVDVIDERDRARDLAARLEEQLARCQEELEDRQDQHLYPPDACRNCGEE